MHLSQPLKLLLSVLRTFKEPKDAFRSALCPDLTDKEEMISGNLSGHGTGDAVNDLSQIAEVSPARRKTSRRIDLRIMAVRSCNTILVALSHHLLIHEERPGCFVRESVAEVEPAFRVDGTNSRQALVVVYLCVFHQLPLVVFLDDILGVTVVPEARSRDTDWRSTDVLLLVDNGVNQVTGCKVFIFVLFPELAQEDGLQG
ncbi:hypothetical protein N7457_008762 [Penicillium paradoxum]|uniref:uncharacterized protein n=1 Tax=Penicillium paradoxum TaxID=176176 RepID=UPI00254904B9|nr:uncharacterized protein N7457_008762 [Penicillium paradoxum]KAJ5773866.1 hypothetical protein N7457_008762 [Penicillium paradoxum]